MGHAQHDFGDSLPRRLGDRQVQQRNQAFGPFERKGLGADEFLADELLEDHRVGEPRENPQLFGAATGECGFPNASIRSCSQVADSGVVDVHELHADVAAIGVLQPLPKLPAPSACPCRRATRRRRCDRGRRRPGRACAATGHRAQAGRDPADRAGRPGARDRESSARGCGAGPAAGPRRAGATGLRRRRAEQAASTGRRLAGAGGEGAGSLEAGEAVVVRGADAATGPGRSAASRSLKYFRHAGETRAGSCRYSPSSCSAKAAFSELRLPLEDSGRSSDITVQVVNHGREARPIAPLLPL